MHTCARPAAHLLRQDDRSRRRARLGERSRERRGQAEGGDVQGRVEAQKLAPPGARAPLRRAVAILRDVEKGCAARSGRTREAERGRAALREMR